jgi:Ribbon-helix-helix protein, copG family
MLVATPLMSKKYDRPENWIHGEKKNGKQFMLTDTAVAAIDEAAKKLGISKSEALERALRCGGMLAAEKYNTETGKCDLQ